MPDATKQASRSLPSKTIAPEDLSRRAKASLPTLIAACVSAFLFQFDLTALSAALPDISTSLSIRIADQGWVISIYSLALIFALPLAGPVADRHGRRRAFIAAAFVFGFASVLCATATTLQWLLIWRALQGLAGALLTACASALLSSVYDGHRRSWAFGIWGTVIGASMVVGPPLGAFIATTLNWKWIFWINVPICTALLFLIARTGCEDVVERNDSALDWAGPVTLALGVGSLAYAMMANHEVGSPIVSTSFMLGIVVSILLLFVCIELRHTAPAFDFALFGSSRFVAMCLVPIASSIGFWALLVHLPQMARGPMDLSPAATGLLLTSLTLPMFLLPTVGAKLAAWLPPRWYFAGGLAIIGAADLMLALVARDLSAPNAIWSVAGTLLIGGSGSALFNAQITAAAISAVPASRAATASAICVTMRQIGFALGIALIGAVLQRGDSFRYANAFLLAGVLTLVLALIAFALFGRVRQ